MLSKSVASAVSTTLLGHPGRAAYFGLKRVSFACSNDLVFTWKNSCFNNSNQKFSFKSRKSSRMESNLVTKVSASAQPLKNADELMDSVETFIFDCDGEILLLF